MNFKDLKFHLIPCIKNKIPVLFEVIFNFTPFFTDFCYQTLIPGLIEGAPDFFDLFPYLMLPKVDDNLIKQDVDRKIAYMQSAIKIVGSVRDR